MTKLNHLETNSLVCAKSIPFLKKLDIYNFIIFTDDISPTDLHREISGCAAFSRQELLFAMANFTGKTEHELISLVKIC